MVFTQRLAGCKKLTITQFKLTGCRINPANPSLMSAVGRRTRCPMNRLSILFFRSICSIREYSKPRLGGVPRSEITCPQEPLAAAAFIVQNGRAWFCMTHPATAVDRAEIGRISHLYVDMAPVVCHRTLFLPHAAQTSNRAHVSEKTRASIRQIQFALKYNFCQPEQPCT